MKKSGVCANARGLIKKNCIIKSLLAKAFSFGCGFGGVGYPKLF